MVQKSPHSKNKWKKVSYLPPLRQSQGPWWEMLFGLGVATHGAGRKQKKDNFLLFYIIIFSVPSSLSLSLQNFMLLNRFARSVCGGWVLNNAIIPCALNGFKINKLEVCAFPKPSG